MSSLSRILHLASHSETPIIIYDAVSDTEFILTRGTTYESSMLDNEDIELSDWYNKERRVLIENMNSDDLIDQINRDIAVWRAKDEHDRRVAVAEKLEEELIVTPLRDPFEEDFMHAEEWHSTADILEDMDIPDLSDASPTDMYGASPYTTPESFIGLQPLVTPPLSWEETTQKESEHKWSPVYPIETVSPPTAEPIRFEEEPFDPPMEDLLQIEEALTPDGTSVFYDEPVM